MIALPCSGSLSLSTQVPRGVGQGLDHFGHLIYSNSPLICVSVNAASSMEITILDIFLKDKFKVPHLFHKNCALFLCNIPSRNAFLPFS